MSILGEHIYFDSFLKRKSEYIQKEYGKVEYRAWREIKLKVQQSGIIIGIRSYVNGENHYDSEIGNIFHPKEHISILLIVTSLYKKPIPILFTQELKNKLLKSDGKR